jgi:Gram-negative porin
MKSKFPLVTAAVVALCGGAASNAWAGVEDHVTFSGFGTLGGVVTNNDDVNFRRDQQPDGATKTIDTGVDTDLGVQMNVQATSWLSATVQGLALKRYEHEKNMEIEWAFLKATPLPGLSVRAGRMAMSTFLVSDSRNVGYANTWLRAPNEVYGLALLPRIEGGDVSYTREFGGVHVTGTATAGHSEANVVGQRIAMHDVHGLNLQVQMGDVTARVGRVTADADAPGIQDTYKFNSLGVSYDKDKILAQGEYVQRRSDNFYNTVAADGWYAMGGYRFGSLTPYAMVSRTTPKQSASEAPSPIGALSGKQQTLAAGVRWDATSFAAIKFQYERVDADGTNGISFEKPGPEIFPGVPNTMFISVDTVNVFSATIDFVF